jgi:hypothetical protein
MGSENVQRVKGLPLKRQACAINRRGILRLRVLAAAYEMDDFIAVARLHLNVRPLSARQNFQIAFNSYTAGGQVKGLQQIRNGGPVRDVSLFSVDNNCERSFHRF